MAVIVPVTVTPIQLSDLTTAQVTGTGVFDVLMQAAKGHLEQEFTKGRIKGTEYSTVYLGSLQAILSQAVEFLLNKDKHALEGQLLAAQIEKLQAEKALVEQQTLDLAEKLQAEKALVEQQTLNLTAQIEKIQAEKALVEQQTLNLAEKLQAEKALVEQQTLNLAAQIEKIQVEKALVAQQTLNAAKELLVLEAQICKLQAEYDMIMATKLKTAEERALLQWKAATEKAQTLGTGVDPDSVVGKQKQLYQAQADGFKRDAEQKAAKIMSDSWSVQRTTDNELAPSATNKLDAASIGRAVGKMLDGVNA